MFALDDRGFVPVSGGRLYYEVDGEGPPLVLIHAGIANLRQWDPQVPAFAERYRVIRYDTRGFGRSESEHVDFTNRDDLAAVLDHFGASAARILGTSRSGSIALDFTVTNPDRVEALIVVAGGVGGFSTEVPAEQAALGEEMERESEKAWNAKDWARLADLETQYWVNGPGQPADRVEPGVQAMVHDWILTTYQAEKEEAIPQPLDPPAATRLDAVTMPLMVVIGELDEAHTNAACRFLADSVPGSRFEVMRGAAHMPNLEQPEAFTRLVLEFLAEVDRPP
jgi:3-oxoadipate enol-lactonase